MMRPTSSAIAAEPLPLPEQVGRSLPAGSRPWLATASSRTIAIVLAGTLLLNGCATVTMIKDKAVELASSAGDYVMGRQSGNLKNDGTDCFANERVAFYAAVDEVTAAQRKEVGAGVGVAVAGFAALYADSVVAKLAAVGFGAVMVAVIADIESDRTRIKAVTDTFNALVKCRKREVQKINAAYDAGKLDEANARSQIRTLKQLMDDDIKVAQGTNAILNARTEGFALSTKQVATDAPPPASKQDAAARASQTKKANAAVQTNQRVLSQQGATIKQAESLTATGGGFDLSLRQTPWITIADSGL